jgi:hypothetical protein
MRTNAILLLALLPMPASADFDCTITQLCKGDQCRTVEGDSRLLREVGDNVWHAYTVTEGTINALVWEGHETAGPNSAGVNLTATSSWNGTNDLISVQPDGKGAFLLKEVHGTRISPFVRTGTCVRDGGS